MSARKSDQRGVALVQVLIMSVLLTILATGLLKMTFGTHVMVSKVRHTDVRKQWVEACRSLLEIKWAGGACNSSDRCINGAEFPSWDGPVVTVSCPPVGRARFTVTN